MKINPEQLKRKELIEIYYKKSRTAKLITILLIIAIVGILYFCWNELSDTKDTVLSSLNESNELYDCKLTLSNVTGFDVDKYCHENESSEPYKFVKGFFNTIFQLDRPYWQKALIFLGCLYLFQIILALAFDLIEVIMMFYLIIKKSGQGIWWGLKKIFGKKDAKDSQ